MTHAVCSSLISSVQSAWGNALPTLRLWHFHCLAHPDLLSFSLPFVARARPAGAQKKTVVPAKGNDGSMTALGPGPRRRTGRRLHTCVPYRENIHHVRSTTGRFSDSRLTARLLPIRLWRTVDYSLPGFPIIDRNRRSQRRDRRGFSPRSRFFTYLKAKALRPIVELCTLERTCECTYDTMPNESSRKTERTRIYRTGQWTATVGRALAAESQAVRHDRMTWESSARCFQGVQQRPPKACARRNNR